MKHHPATTKKAWRFLTSRGALSDPKKFPSQNELVRGFYALDAQKTAVVQKVVDGLGLKKQARTKLISLLVREFECPVVPREPKKTVRASRQPFRPSRPVSIQTQVLVEGKAVESNDFLGTYEWRRVRMIALKKYGARCQCCGASPADGAVMNVDHIKPRRLFPALALDVDNLQVLCSPCNHGKGNWDMTDWRFLDDDSRNRIQDLLAS